MKKKLNSCGLVAVSFLVLTMLFFGSCSKTSEDVTEKYTITFVTADFTDVAEFSRIDSAYIHSIGVGGDEFALYGSDDDENDAKVKAGCAKAQAFLNTLTFKGYYELRVMRGTNEIHVAVYGTKKTE